MRKLFFILTFLYFNIVSADSGNSYVLKIEICTINDETINGFVKTNDYFIDRYINGEVNEPFKDFIIGTVHFTRESGKFTYFEKSVHYLLNAKINSNVGYDLYQLQKEMSISNEKIKSILIIDKKKERNHTRVVNNLNKDDQFWLSKQPIKIINIGCIDEYCCQTAIIYSIDEEIKIKVEQNENEPTENLYDFFWEKIRTGQKIVIIENCTE